MLGYHPILRIPRSHSHASLRRNSNLLLFAATDRLEATDNRLDYSIDPIINGNLMIKQRTEGCLDFDLILTTLKNLATTVLGKDLVHTVQYSSAKAARRAYAKIAQLTPQLSILPLYSELDIWPVLRAIEMNSSPPEREEMAHFSHDIEMLVELKKFFSDNVDKLDLFQEVSDQLTLPTELVEVFHSSFDEELNLNPAKYPTIRVLSDEISLLKLRIIQSLQRVLQSPDMKDKISDQ